MQTLTDTQILADSFETRFSPFTLERPRVRTRPSKRDEYHLRIAVSASSGQYSLDRIHLRVPCQRWSRRSLCLLWRTYRPGRGVYPAIQMDIQGFTLQQCRDRSLFIKLDR